MRTLFRILVDIATVISFALLCLALSGCDIQTDEERYQAYLIEYNTKDGKYVDECRSAGGVPTGWINQYGLLMYKGCSFPCAVDSKPKFRPDHCEAIVP